MVSYQKFTSICYDVAKTKGASLEGPGTQQNNQDLVSVIADIWNDYKDELIAATVAEAREIALREIEV